MGNKREKIHFESVEELLGAPVTEDGVEEIKIERIYPFENHPFKVVDDERMAQLVDSIINNGVITPVIVRPDDNGCFEMISGHRRMYAAKKAGLSKIPAVVKKMTDDESIIAMVDANVQREEILPSERAWSFKMKMDAMKRQGARTDRTSGTQCPKLTVDIIGKESGFKGRQVKNYIRLTYLIPDILDLVDEKKLSIIMAVDISYFDKEMQKWIYDYRKENGILRAEQIKALREQPNIDNLTQYTMNQILSGAIPKPETSGKVSLSEKKLNKYFPSHFSSAQREKVIIGLLEEWISKRDSENIHEV